MDLRKLKTLIDLVAESDISELEVTEGTDSKVRIVKQTPVAYTSLPPIQTYAQVNPMVAQAPVSSPTSPEPVAQSEVKPDLSGHVVKAPMLVLFIEHQILVLLHLLKLVCQLKKAILYALLKL